MRVGETQLDVLPVRLCLTPGPFGPEPPSARRSSFSPENEHHDLPWF